MGDFAYSRDVIRPVFHRMSEADPGLDYAEVLLETDRGRVSGRVYGPSSPECAVVFLGGVAGGWDTPAFDLYPRLCEELAEQGVASLRLRFRDTRRLSEGVHDALAGLTFLTQRGHLRLGVVGHSFGAAVALCAAASQERVRSVVTLATQTEGAECVRLLGPRCSTLIIHGEADNVLSADGSRWVYVHARPPKELVLFPNTGHVLQESAESVAELVGPWLTRELCSIGEDDE